MGVKGFLGVAFIRVGVVPCMKGGTGGGGGGTK